MTKNEFSLPDMGDLMNQLNKAMSEAEDALENLDTDDTDTDSNDLLGGLTGLMGSLSSLTEGLPGDLGDLTGAIDGFDQVQSAQSGTMIGNPDWRISADIRVGDVLHIIVNAVFDLGIIASAWKSTQGIGADALVGGIVKGVVGDMGPDVMDQVMEQLKKGRAFAVVEDIQVLSCTIAGAPSDAAETLHLSPEANIPLVMDQAGLGFEFAPLLSVKNQWENAPTFEPMGEQIVVPIKAFDIDDAFARSFNVTQEQPVVIRLDFQPV